MTFEAHWTKLPYWIRKAVRHEDDYGSEPQKSLDELWKDVLLHFESVVGRDYEGHATEAARLHELQSLLTTRSALEGVIYSKSELTAIHDMLQDAFDRHVHELCTTGPGFIERITSQEDPGEWTYNTPHTFREALSSCTWDLYMLRERWKA